MKMHLLHIMFLFSLGLLFTPVISHACGGKTTAEEKARCKKGKSKSLFANNSSHKKCCNTKNKNKSCSRECGGKCDNSACKCVASCNVPAAATLVQSSITEQFPGLKNHQSLLRSAHISSGFCFIWLPPKISQQLA